MAIKPVLKLLITASIYAVASSSYAGCLFSPYLGAEYKLSHTKAKTGWGKMLPTNKLYSNGSLFGGLNVCDCLATELGYTKSSKRTKSSYTSNQQIAAGIIAPANSSQNITLSYDSWNLDLNGKYPANDGFSFLGTLGLVVAKPKIHAINTGSSTTNRNIETISGKRKIFGRLGLGFQYAKGIFGVRTRVIMENSSRLRMDPGSTRYSAKAFNNTYGLTLGGFVTL